MDEFYSLRHLNSYTDCFFKIIIGSRMSGKSYAVADYFCSQYKKYHIPFYWMRLTENQTKKLLQNDAEKLIDPDLRRKYGLDLIAKAGNVYNVLKRSEPDKNGKTRILKKELFARVLNLSTFYKDKGSLFDKDWLNMNPRHKYLIALDEFQVDTTGGETKRFDIVYNLANQLENIARTTKERISVYMLGNTLEESSDILAAFNFIPEKPGLYRIKKKRCIIENIENSDAYIQRRRGSLADILMPKSSNFTNKININNVLICKDKLVKPLMIIKFSKDPNDWFTVWNSNIITKFAKGHFSKNIVAMRPYLDEPYIKEKKDLVFSQFDTRNLRFNTLIAFKQFESHLQSLRYK
jgi:hypothetical protein